MREIKFRFYDRLHNDMQEVRELSKEWVLVYYPPQTRSRENGNLMQYTGLKDNNGVEIYESDLCRSSRGGVFKVIYEGAGFIATDGAVNMRPGFWNEQFEVIGNLFEDKELLE